jgi:hypothetical protein
MPLGANLIRVENLLNPSVESPSIPFVKSRSPFRRGCIFNVNIIEPAVLACVTSLANHGHLTRSVIPCSPPVPSLLKRRFDVLGSAFQKSEAAQSFFEVANKLHSQ